jgi:hypothetical protein
MKYFTQQKTQYAPASSNRYATLFYTELDCASRTLHYVKENLLNPDVEIPESWNDYRNGRDPVLDWVLEERDSGTN